MTRLTLIGIGSTFGTDELGLEAARYIADELAEQRIVETDLHLTANPAADVPALLAHADCALLIDAVAPEIVLGAPIRVSLEMLEQWQATSSHGIGLGTTMELLHTLDVLPPRWAVIGVPERLADTPSIWQPKVRQLTGEILADWTLWPEDDDASQTGRHRE